MPDDLAHYMEATSRLRGQLTIAEDALRAIADPACGIEVDDEGWSSINTSVASRIAEGALRRIEATAQNQERR